MHEAKLTAEHQYLAFEYCAKGDLFNYLYKSTRQNADFTPEIIVSYTRCLLIALEHLHSLGIVYRE
jgi:serine/threonine protein kinase